MYNKLFTKILDSSIWLEQTPTRIVWITLMAAMDEDGFCAFASPANLARRAVVTDAECLAALAILEAPDVNSADPENEGRRIERMPGGWYVLNAPKYREIVTREESKRLHRERQRRYRNKDGVTPNVTLGDAEPSRVTLRDAEVTPHAVRVTQSDTETEAETKTEVRAERRSPARPFSGTQPNWTHQHRHGTGLVGNHTKCDPVTSGACARGVCVPPVLFWQWRAQCGDDIPTGDTEIRRVIAAELAQHEPGPIGIDPLKLWRNAWEREHPTTLKTAPREGSLDALEARMRAKGYA